MLGPFPSILQSRSVPPHWPLFISPMPLGPRQREGAPEGRRPDPEAQQGSRGHVRGGNAGCTSPDPLVLEGPPPPHHLPLLLSPLLCSSHAPRIHKAGGGPREWRTRPGSPAGFPGPEWVGETPSVPHLILQSWRAPPHPTLIFSPRLPPTLLGPVTPGGGLGGWGTWPGSPAGFLRPKWVG